MAFGLNQITISGAIITKPVLSTISGGRSMLKFTISGIADAVDRFGRVQVNQAGEVIRTSYYRHITLFGRQAELLAEHPVDVGTALLITGRLNSRDWTDQETGSKRSSLDVRAETVHVLDTSIPPGRDDYLYEEDVKGQDRLAYATNHVRLIGHLTYEAELEQTKEEAVNYLRLRVAATTSYRDAKGEMQDTTAFIDVTVWRDLAKDLQVLPKGAAIYVEGLFLQRAWDTQEGNRVYQDYVEATNVEVLHRPGKHTTAEASPEHATPAQPHHQAPAAQTAPAPQQTAVQATTQAPAPAAPPAAAPAVPHQQETPAMQPQQPAVPHNPAPTAPLQPAPAHAAPPQTPVAQPQSLNTPPAPLPQAHVPQPQAEAHHVAPAAQQAPEAQVTQGEGETSSPHTITREQQPF